jgi:four helix bundle protein
VKGIAKTLGNVEDGKQLIRSSGSVGSNYIEANEAISKKDFAFRLRVSRKEAKESRFWLRLLDTDGDASATSEREKLIQESTELMKILGAILRKSE